MALNNLYSNSASQVARYAVFLLGSGDCASCGFCLLQLTFVTIQWLFPKNMIMTAGTKRKPKPQTYKYSLMDFSGPGS